MVVDCSKQIRRYLLQTAYEIKGVKMKVIFDPNHEVDYGVFAPVILVFFSKEDQHFQYLKYQITNKNGLKKPDYFFTLDTYELVKTGGGQKNYSAEEYKKLLECFESKEVQNYCKNNNIHQLKSKKEYLDKYVKNKTEVKFTSDKQLYKNN
jgi:hypothetical protein